MEQNNELKALHEKFDDLQDKVLQLIAYKEHADRLAECLNTIVKVFNGYQGMQFKDAKEALSQYRKAATDVDSS